jgi:flagellin
MSNVNVLSADQQLRLIGKSQENLLSKLANGKRIQSAADDAANLQIANRLTSSVNGVSQGYRNSQDGMSLARVADQALQGIGDSMQQLQELSVQAGNGLLNSDDRQALQKQANAITDSIRQQIGQAEFGGVPLFAGEGQIPVATGQGSVFIKTSDLTQRLDDQGALVVDFSDSGKAEASLGALQQAQKLIDDERTGIGATINRLDATSRQLNNRSINEQVALSQLQDLDYARASSERAAGQVREQAANSIAVQARINSAQASKLLGFG